MHKLMIDGASLTPEDVIRVAHDPTIQVFISEDAKARIQKAAQVVHDFVTQGKIVYGITTGFGAFKDRIIPPDKVNLLQHNILVSHAVGVGSPLDEPTTRAMMLIRANTLAHGHSGIRLQTLELLLSMLNLGIHPIIPEKGSLGASGDLAPLAHMALPLIGEGEVIYQGEHMPSKAAFTKAGLSPIELCAKEGLALTNGTTLMTALGVLNLKHATDLILTANLAAAATLEAVNGTPRAFDPRIHALRPYPHQIATAQHIRNLIQGSQLTRKDDSSNVQDSYTLRCVPQVHGAVHDAIAYTQSLINIELNAVTDNPLIFFDEYDRPEIISGGNFHGEPLAFAMDFLSIALTDLGNISERRTMKMLDESMNHLLPGFLTPEGGINSGFMLLQYTAAALCSENKVLSHPSSTDSIPSSANVEDHVSMGVNAALHTRAILDNLDTILAIELICATQALDFRLESLVEETANTPTSIPTPDSQSVNPIPSSFDQLPSSLNPPPSSFDQLPPSLNPPPFPLSALGNGTHHLYTAMRNIMPFLKQDIVLYPYLNRVQALVHTGKIADIALKYL